MTPSFSGKFIDFDKMKPGDVFIFHDKNYTIQRAMKVRWASDAADKNYAIRFFEPNATTPTASVVFSPAVRYVHEHTLMVLDNLVIEPTDKYAFQGVSELGGSAVGAGWLGSNGDKAFLSFTITDPGSAGRTGFVNLTNGMVQDQAPIAAWYTAWRIVVPTPGGQPDPIFEMR